MLIQLAVFLEIFIVLVRGGREGAGGENEGGFICGKGIIRIHPIPTSGIGCMVLINCQTLSNLVVAFLKIVFDFVIQRFRNIGTEHKQLGLFSGDGCFHFCG